MPFSLEPRAMGLDFWASHSASDGASSWPCNSWVESLKYSMRLQEGGKVPHQIPLQAMSNESKQRNVQVQPCEGRICSNFLSMNIEIKLRGSCRSD
ncbi:hypothetical protein BDL97_10G012600 [Sphagnum fallax]|nr:hypothetical protein BDL97_10G012600 [Sphagnum fallax]KAH8949089.1 hypothetical protein BDL97_10G012600 [Sphagnum fallax]